MVEAIVTFDYDAVQDDELNLKKGQTITNISMMEEGWWEGEVNGQRGLFPDNFVELLNKDKPVPMKGKAPSPPPSAPAAAPTPTPASASTTVNGDSQEVTRREGVDKTKKLRAKVVYSYHPQNEDEISLNIDDVIEVTGQPEEGWWEGLLRGKKGLFPSNFVAVIEGEEGASSGKEDKVDGAAQEGEPPPVPAEGPQKPTKVKGVGFGNIFAGGEVKLRKTGGSGAANHSKKGPVPTGEPSELAQKRLSLKRPDAIPSPKPTNSVVAKPREEARKPPKPADAKREDKKEAKVEEEEFEEIVRQKAKVTFPYEAQQPDELELKDGDVVTVLDKEAGDSGWWLGEVDGRKGLFPDNFVTMLPPEKERILKKKPPAMPAPMPARPVSGPRLLPSENKPTASKPSTKPPPPLDNPAPLHAQPRRTSANQDTVTQQKEEPPPRKPHPIAAPKPVLPIPSKKPKPKAPPPKPSGPPPEREESQPAVVLRHTKPQENAQEPAGGFEDLKPDSGQKLTHITLSRPKNANRRPPSVFGGQGVNLSEARDKVLHEEESKDSPDGRIPSPSNVLTSPTSPPNSSQPPWVRELKARSIKRPSPLAKPQPPVENGTAAPPPRPKSSPIGPTPAATSPPQSTPAASKAQTEASPAQSPATSRPESLISDSTGQASSAQVEELKKEIKALKDQMASMKADFKKEVVNLMSEVDEEKKYRMAMQVELDRVKKLVLEKK